MRTQRQPLIQGYNAQAAVNENQIIVAAEVNVDPPDFGHLEPMLNAVRRELENIGIDQPPDAVVADAGYWHKAQMQRVTEAGIELLVPPDGGKREGTRPGWNDGLYEQLRDKLSTDYGNAIYRQRAITIEPVFGQIKFNRRIDRFLRRGRAAARSEWRLTAATHNLLKLHSHWIANTA
jgi:DDE family transposase